MEHRHKGNEFERQGNVIFFEKLKIVERKLRKLNCSYGKLKHTLKHIKWLISDCKSFRRGSTLLTMGVVFKIEKD